MAGKLEPGPELGLSVVELEPVSLELSAELAAEEGRIFASCFIG